MSLVDGLSDVLCVPSEASHLIWSFLSQKDALCGLACVNRNLKRAAYSFAPNLVLDLEAEGGLPSRIQKRLETSVARYRIQRITLRKRHLSKHNAVDWELSPSLVQCLPPSLVSLCVQGLNCRIIPSLATLKALQELELSHTRSVEEVPAEVVRTDLADRIRALDLSYTAITNVGSLTCLRQLQILNLEGTHIDDISPLRSLARTLIHLNISHSKAVHEFGPLSVLTNLTSLYVQYTKVSDIAALETLKRLKVLSISNTAVSNLSVLPALTSLCKLDLEYCRGIAESPLSRLSLPSQRLHTLNISDCNLTDISGLSTLVCLRKLNLSNNNHIIDVSPLNVLVDLRWLNLSKIGARDFSVLDSLSSLHYLKLDSNEMHRWSPQSWRNLHTLHLSSITNNIHSLIFSVKMLENLQSLHLGYSWVARQAVFALSLSTRFVQSLVELDLCGSSLFTPPDVGARKKGNSALQNIAKLVNLQV